MGGIHRLKKRMNPKMVMADTHVAINGCKVLLGHPNPETALAAAKGFNKMFAITVARSHRPNIYDIYSSSLSIRSNLESGEPIWS